MGKVGRKRKNPGGQMPRNSLGETPNNKKPKFIASPKNTRLRAPSVESDATLLLGAAPAKQKYKSVPLRTSIEPPSDNDTDDIDTSFASDPTKHNSTKWTHRKGLEKPPVFKIYSDSQVIPDDDSDDGNILSDAESNSLEVKLESILDLSDFDARTFAKDKKVTKIVAPLQALSLGDNVPLISGHYKTYFIHITRDLSKIQIIECAGNNTTDIVAINPLRDVKKICVADTQVVFFTGIKLNLGTKQHNRFKIELSQTNYKRFRLLWKVLADEHPDNSELTLEETSTANLINEIRTLSKLSPASNPRLPGLRKGGLKGKDMGSLSKRGRPNGFSASKISFPITPAKSLPSATKPDVFYKPAPVTPTVHTPQPTDKASILLYPRRQLRSADKDPSTEPPEYISIEDIEAPRTKRAKKEPFKPSLNYVFSDKTLYEVKENDFHCLFGSEWINDTIIDFFIKYFFEEAIKNSKIDSLDGQVLSTFFMYKLKTTKNHYENIERWVSKLDLLNKKFIILPVNEALHWFGLIIYNLDALINEPEGKGIATIYAFDSLKQKHNDLLEPLSNFLIGYAKDKYGKLVEPNQIKLITASVPKQPNFNDCGVHVIYNIMKFLDEPEKCIQVWNQENSGKELGALFVKGERNNMRINLRDKLKAMLIEQERDKPESSAAEGNTDLKPGDESVHDTDDEILFIDAKTFHSREGSWPDEKSEEITKAEGDQRIAFPLKDSDSEELIDVSKVKLQTNPIDQIDQLMKDSDEELKDIDLKDVEEGEEVEKLSSSQFKNIDQAPISTNKNENVDLEHLFDDPKGTEENTADFQRLHAKFKNLRHSENYKEASAIAASVTRAVSQLDLDPSVTNKPVDYGSAILSRERDDQTKTPTNDLIEPILQVVASQDSAESYSDNLQLKSPYLSPNIRVESQDLPASQELTNSKVVSTSQHLSNNHLYISDKKGHLDKVEKEDSEAAVIGPIFGGQNDHDFSEAESNTRRIFPDTSDSLTTHQAPITLYQKYAYSEATKGDDDIEDVERKSRNTVKLTLQKLKNQQEVKIRLGKRQADDSVAPLYSDISTPSTDHEAESSQKGPTIEDVDDYEKLHSVPSSPMKPKSGRSQSRNETPTSSTTSSSMDLGLIDVSIADDRTDAIEKNQTIDVSDDQSEEVADNSDANGSGEDVSEYERDYNDSTRDALMKISKASFRSD